MMNIPADVWVYIARFIPSRVLRDLYSVNRVFLDLALNERYREVNFLQVDQLTLQLLEHLRNPHISTRVRNLRVNPVWFNLRPMPISKLSVRAVRFLIRRIPFDLGRPAYEKTMSSHQARRQLIDIITISIVLEFSNVTSFAIVTKYLPHPKSLFPFLSNAWTTFGSSLQKLTINAPLGSFESLLPPTATLKSLEELTLHFSTDMSSDDKLLDTQRLRQVIAPFLRGISPNIRKLNIVSSALGDHSELFHALGYIPRLISLSLTIAFYPPLLTDPSKLTRFLNRNAETLKHVKIQPYECFRAPSVTGPAHDHFTKWITDSLPSGVFLSNLQTLVMLPPTMSPPASLAVISSCIQRSRDTLTRLVLGERCLSFAELSTFVDIFAHRPAKSGLKTLHIKVVSLNPQVFDLLAKKLPGLEDLNIKFNHLLPDVENEGLGISRDEEPEEQLEQAIEAFLDEMGSRMYREWGLCSLWIWQLSHMTMKAALDILVALRPSIPSMKITYQMDCIHPLYTVFS